MERLGSERLSQVKEMTGEGEVIVSLSLEFCSLDCALPRSLSSSPVSRSIFSCHIRYWLQNEGSPQSRVSNAIFKNERRIDITNYKDFGVRNG